LYVGLDVCVSTYTVVYICTYAHTNTLTDTHTHTHTSRIHTPPHT